MSALNSLVDGGELCTGGIAGKSGSECTLSDCQNTGNIIGGRAAGISAENQGIITECSNAGVITANGESGAYAGGISGDSKGKIANCWNQGEVSATVTSGSEFSYRVAGICNGVTSAATVVNCYNSGVITGEGYWKAPIADSDANVTNCYYLGDEETDSLEGAVCKTAEQFASGEVCYLLNEGNPEPVFRQDLGNGQFSGFRGGTVYKVEKYDCPGDTVPDIVYSNTDSVIRGSEHSLGQQWNTDGDAHWKVCEYCDSKLEKAAHSGGRATYSEQAVCELCGEKYGEMLVDTINPFGKIKVGERNWNSFTSSVTFDIFSGDT